MEKESVGAIAAAFYRNIIEYDSRNWDKLQDILKLRISLKIVCVCVNSVFTMSGWEKSKITKMLLVLFSIWLFHYGREELNY